MNQRETGIQEASLDSQLGFLENFAQWSPMQFSTVAAIGPEDILDHRQAGEWEKHSHEVLG